MRWLAVIFLSLLTVVLGKASDFDYPVGSPSRKGVGISTDVVAIGMPVATVALVIAKKDWEGLLRGSIEGVATVGVTYLMKTTIHKRRPDGSDRQSFPSMHSATAFADASFLMRRYGWKFGVPAYALAGYVAWGRVYSKKHDGWDVLTGAAIGTAIGLLGTTPFVKEHELNIAPATDGNGSVGFTASMKF